MVLIADAELPFGLRGPKIRLAFEPNRDLCHLPFRSGLRILISALLGQRKTLWTILVRLKVFFSRVCYNIPA
jgi:hypothetical protein